MSGTYATTRHSLHGLAELVLAGPRYAAGGSMRLRAGSDGIRPWDDPPLLLAGEELVAGTTRVSLHGSTYAAVADHVGLVAHPLDDVYHDGPHVSPDEVITLDPTQVQVVLEALGRGDRALRAFSPSAEPVLWPEHFDVAITVDDVNYGVSPGDGYLDQPYAYVGPHGPRTGAFWNAPFGASRPLDDVAEVAALVAFFAEGADTAARG
jgi:hypothetical protein